MDTFFSEIDIEPLLVYYYRKSLELGGTQKYVRQILNAVRYVFIVLLGKTHVGRVTPRLKTGCFSPKIGNTIRAFFSL